MKIAQTLLINWIYILCFLGGFVNSVSIAKFSYTVSHFTGSISRMAIDIATDSVEIMSFKLFLIILAFVCGAALAGYVIDGRDFNLKRRYGYVFLVLGTFLLFLDFFAINNFIFFYYLPFLMGVQNGLFITYKGVVLRTTHVTGSITDAGVFLGHFLKGRIDEIWKLKLCSFMVLFFFLGGYAGIKLYVLYHKFVFVLLGISYIIVAHIYFLLRHRHLNHLSLREEESPFK